MVGRHAGLGKQLEVIETKATKLREKASEKMISTR
jgi:hypothetical protein